VLKLLAIPILITVISLGLVAFGRASNDNDSSTTADLPTAENGNPAASISADGVQEISVTSGERGDQYYFDVSSTHLKTGKVRVTLSNSGPERQHTFVVKKQDGSGNLAEIKQTDPRKTGTVEFELTSAGTYQFQCDLRGHADRGQKGTFTVTS
jgi:uncharacterized cupredoxin-like copper-binding protein